LPNKRREARDSRAITGSCQKIIAHPFGFNLAVLPIEYAMEIKIRVTIQK
jgi:hypothetical protein